MAEVRVQVDGRELAVSNLDKILYPASGTTKAEIIDYYARIAPIMLPHLTRRAATLVRAPNGPDGQVFFEKRRPPGAPDWVHSGGELGSVVVDDGPTLIWLANLAALELHTHQHTVDDPAHPTSAVLDLDPGPPADILDCARVALDLRGSLEHIGLVSVVKTSGSKGLHVAVPLHGSTTSDEITKAFALTLGQHLADADRKRVTTDMNRAKRAGKVFVDWSQNDRHKTTVAAYSLRIRERPTVSTPVTWDEVATALDARDPDRLVFETADVLERVERLGDLYAANLSEHQMIPGLA